MRWEKDVDRKDGVIIEETGGKKSHEKDFPSFLLFLSNRLTYAQAERERQRKREMSK